MIGFSFLVLMFVGFMVLLVSSIWCLKIFRRFFHQCEMGEEKNSCIMLSTLYIFQHNFRVGIEYTFPIKHFCSNYIHITYRWDDARLAIRTNHDLDRFNYQFRYHVHVWVVWAQNSVNLKVHTFFSSIFELYSICYLSDYEPEWKGIKWKEE